MTTPPPEPRLLKRVRRYALIFMPLAFVPFLALMIVPALSNAFTIQVAFALMAFGFPLAAFVAYIAHRRIQAHKKKPE